MIYLFQMRPIAVNEMKRSRSSQTGLWRYLTLAVLAGTVMLGAGCDTPYTRRVGQLDDAYQRGELSHEDYMRFVHEAEQWEIR